ncbi:MAG TPA: bacillithiol system redox-active protein YtxJ [Longimicrobiaceae bacterium]|jgi:bacillithiol system protein YtxJ|nr:bacillithiol system redox-active protein YtxJ [Longimicrobiaceae bacterium]
MKELTTQEELDAAFQAGSAILFKHSTHCPISAMAHKEMESFVAAHPEAAFYKVDVHDQADLSAAIGQRTGIQHESPQVIVLKDGKPQWDASRFEINAASLDRQVSMMTD